MSTNAINIKGLKKAYDKPVITGLDLTLPHGQFYALLGPNGAGKTTILRMIAGLLPPDEGQIEVCGINVADNPVAAKQRVAWVSDEPMIYDRLTPLEYLQFVAGLWHIPAEQAEPRARDLLNWLELSAVANTRAGGFSKGMMQKLALAGALIHDPQVIILDEPLTGLDAASARLVKDVLRARVADGVTIIMTTHILDVAERMAERIGVINNGRLIAQGSLAELQQKVGQGMTSLEDVFLGLVAEQEAA